MTYSPQEIFLSRVIEMRKKFKLKVGYSNHNNDINNIYLLSAYEPDAIFLYCKQRRKKVEFTQTTNMLFILRN